jgi:hypothetical protein
LKKIVPSLNNNAQQSSNPLCGNINDINQISRSIHNICKILCKDNISLIPHLLELLVEFIYQTSGKSLVVLIDEFDGPIVSLSQNGANQVEIDHMKEFMKDLYKFLRVSIIIIIIILILMIFLRLMLYN